MSFNISGLRLSRLSLGAAVITTAMFALPVAAETIQFPAEELAAESVLPVFDQTVSVKNRAVQTAKRVELGVIGGMSLMEPFYNPVNFGATGTYNITEEHGINLSGLYFMSGLSDNAKKLNPIPNTSPPTYANLQYAPAPKYMLMANYQYTGFYGKISITKDFVMNLSTFGTVGLGMTGVGDTNKPMLNFGLGEMFYVTPSVAIRVDLKMYIYKGPDVLSRRLDNVNKEQAASTFDEKINYGSLLSVGAIFLLPAL